MQTIKDIKALPDGMIVEAVSGILDTVDEQKPYLGGDRPTTVQSFKLLDGKEFIYGSCWGHPDITPFKGKQVIFASVKGGNNRFGGVAVKDRPDKKDPQKKWKNLNVSYSGVLHTPETWASAGGKPTPEAPKPSTMPQDSRSSTEGRPIPSAPESSSVGHPSANINGMTVGMAVGRSVELLIAADPKVCESKEFATRLWQTASEIIRISQKLEAGFLAQKE